MATFSLSNHIVFPAYCFFHDMSGTGPAGCWAKTPVEAFFLYKIPPPFPGNHFILTGK